MADADTTKLQEYIRESERHGKIVVLTVDGLREVNLDEILQQPTEGLLYDLNRDKATVMQFIDDDKWINDYAVALVISRLKEYYDKKMAP
jgi:hypothetical protein